MNLPAEGAGGDTLPDDRPEFLGLAQLRGYFADEVRILIDQRFGTRVALGRGQRIRGVGPRW